ncbi:14254_t:CDS:2 [Funneliformis mosseae]|uniref:14254_t:CDS:1 n=1 Tax=Funneliformis mosseae TaxID=27381 RepID=A0A9N9NC08_FUNMO|nr:14254_t:CDS:2 [Funneliformis mosseae]
MESERSNNILPLAIEEEIFDEDIPNRSIPYHTIQLIASINSQRKSVQRGSETCSFYNKPDLLFKLNGANLKSVIKLSYIHSFYLRCIIISLKKYITYPCCQRPIYLELSKRPQDFNLLPVINVKTENPTTPDMILKEKIREVSCIEYEILDLHYPLGEALEKKLAEFTSIHPLQTARILLNAEIK